MAMPEEQLGDALKTFFPPWFARLVASELTILTHAIVGLRAFMNAGVACGRSYTNGSKIVFAAIIVSVALIPDAIFFGLLLPHRIWWISVALDLLSVWGCFWLFGMYGTMVRRPHELSEGKIVFRNGILQAFEVNPKHIVHVRPLGVVKRYDLPREPGEKSAVLGFGGVQFVEVLLDEPISEQHLFLPAKKPVRKIFVTSDAPNMLSIEVARLAAVARFASEGDRRD